MGLDWVDPQCIYNFKRKFWLIFVVLHYDGVMKLEATKIKHVLQTAKSFLKKMLILEGHVSDVVPVEVLIVAILRIRLMTWMRSRIKVSDFLFVTKMVGLLLQDDQVSLGTYSEIAALKAYLLCKTVPCDQIESVFKNQLQLGLAFQIEGFGCQKIGKWQRTLNNDITLDFGKYKQLTISLFLLFSSDSESTMADVSDQGSSTNVNMRKMRVATCNDYEETISPLKKLKNNFDLEPSIPVKVTFGQFTINFRLLIPLGLLDLENEIAHRLNLEGYTKENSSISMIGLTIHTCPVEMRKKPAILEPALLKHLMMWSLGKILNTPEPAPVKIE
ncbi:NIN-like protein [Artemisia annua]|uniref:NIN-like protein n=1 Tax=Artemisia annua TaxID=35608 RepID=A0A2U1PQ84_ARTAN|nr:NIN-like protein [Artemisia annua]